VQNTPDNSVLEIRKYANRRLYDATRSCDVNHADLHELIVAGRDVRVIDARTNDDITNVVLMQIILEKDPAKLAAFPAGILHQIIRTQAQFMGGVVENFFQQALRAQRSSQDQWNRFVESTLGIRLPAGLPSAEDIARRMLDPFGVMQPPPAPPTPPPASSSDGEIADLKRQLAEMMQRLEQLGGRS
jgi:polyhydroxyalkanoate synthesis repressor PhaR